MLGLSERKTIPAKKSYSSLILLDIFILLPE